MTFDFPSHDSDFSATVIQMSMLHLREEEEKTRQLVSTNVTSVLPALLNTEILRINIPKDYIKKKEVTECENTCNMENKMRDTNSSDPSKIQYIFFLAPDTLLYTPGKSGVFQRQQKWRDLTRRPHSCHKTEARQQTLSGGERRLHCL